MKRLKMAALALVALLVLYGPLVAQVDFPTLLFGSFEKRILTSEANTATRLKAAEFNVLWWTITALSSNRNTIWLGTYNVAIERTEGVGSASAGYPLDVGEHMSFSLSVAPSPNLLSVLRQNLSEVYIYASAGDGVRIFYATPGH